MLSRLKRRPFRRHVNRRMRRPAYEAIEIYTRPGQPPYAGILKDISANGAHLHVFDAKNLPKRFTLGIRILKTTVDCELKWRKGNRIGVEFARLVDIGPMPSRPKVDRREIIAAQFRSKLRVAEN